MDASSVQQHPGNSRTAHCDLSTLETRSSSESVILALLGSYGEQPVAMLPVQVHIALVEEWDEEFKVCNKSFWSAAVH